MDELTPELRALLARGRAESQPAAGDEERIRAKLSVSMASFDGLHGVGGAPLPVLEPSARMASAEGLQTSVSQPGAVASSAPVAAGATAAAGATVWVAAGALVLAMTGYWALDRQERAESSTRVRSTLGTASQPSPQMRPQPRFGPVWPEAVVPEPARAAEALDPQFAPAPGRPEEVAAPHAAPAPRSVRHAKRRPARRAGRSTASLNQQVVMLQSAARALHGGDPGAAAALLRIHAQRFPRSILSPERDVLQVRTLCALGDDEAARERAAAFLEQHPDSPLALRMQQACPPR